MGENDNEHNIDSDDKDLKVLIHKIHCITSCPKVEISKDTNGQVSGFNVDIQSQTVSESSLIRDEEIL